MHMKLGWQMDQQSSLKYHRLAGKAGAVREVRTGYQPFRQHYYTTKDHQSSLANQNTNVMTDFEGSTAS